jgi:hypothetical protein
LPTCGASKQYAEAFRFLLKTFKTEIVFFIYIFKDNFNITVRQTHSVEKVPSR